MIFQVSRDGSTAEKAKRTEKAPVG